MKFLAPIALLALATPVFADCGVRTVYRNHVVNNHAVVVKVERRVFFSVGEDTLSNDDIERVARAVTKNLEVVGQEPSVGEPAPRIEPSDLDFNLVGTVSPKRTPKGNLDAQVFAIMNTSCIQCHKPGATSPGGIQLFTADRKLFAAADATKEKKRRERIADAVDISKGGTMPKDRSRLSASQIALIRRWSEE